MKTALKDNNNNFRYMNNQKSIIYHGTKVNKCESMNESGRCYALAINTGFTTNRGNLIQNILFPKPTNFKFIQKSIPVFLGMVACFVVVQVYFMYEYTRTRKGK